MSGWKTFKDVTVSEVFVSADAVSCQFRIILTRRNEGEVFDHHYEVDIKQHDFKDRLQRLLQGKSEREYFAYGMANIDVYGRGDTFVIDCSPFDGCHDEYILKKGELERLVHLLTLSEQKEVALKTMLEKMANDLNSSRSNGNVLFASDWNEELEKLGIKTLIKEDSRIVVDQMI